MRVLWLTNIPSPYRVDFFNELGSKCELTVLFEQRSSAERDSSWKEYDIKTFKALFLTGRNIGVAESFCPSVIRYLKKDYDHIVVTNFSDVTGAFAILWMKMNGISYEIESDGGFPGSGKGIRERVKKYLLSGAKLYYSTALEHDRYYLRYGAKPERIVRYPFTSVRYRDLIENVLTDNEKAEAKELLGITESKCVLSVGRFTYQKGYGKGFDVLLKVAEELDNNVGVYIVGDKPTAEFLDIVEKNKERMQNVHFIDFQLKDQLSLWYRAADVFVLLSRGEAWGLVINEAMAKGLPVVASDKCIAGLEMIENGENGYIVATASAPEAVRAIQSIIEDDCLRYKMEVHALKTVKRYTIENMAEEHINRWCGR